MARKRNTVHKNQLPLFIGTAKEKVLAVLNHFGPLTDEQIAAKLKMNPNTARPRRIELEQEGKIITAGIGYTKSGRSAYKWFALVEA